MEKTCHFELIKNFKIKSGNFDTRRRSFEASNEFNFEICLTGAPNY